MNANTGEIKEQTVFMGDFPMMTDKGTFIINGTERVVVSQLVRSPGVIFQPGERFRLRNLSKHQLVTGTIHPYRSEWIEMDVEQKPGKDVTAGARVARKRRISLFTLLRALGYDEENEPGFLDRFVQHFDFLEGQWEKDRESPRPRKRRCSRSTSGRVRASRRPSSRLVPTSQRLLRAPSLRPQPCRPLQAEPQARPRTRLLDRAVRSRPRAPREDQSVLAQAEMLAATTYLLNLAKESRATALTTRTTSPTAASAASAS